MVAHIKGEITLPTRMVTIPDEIDVKSIREKSGMSQGEFAKTFCINSRSLQDWEQGRRKPESAVRAYLTVIERESRVGTPYIDPLAQLSNASMGTPFPSLVT